MISGFHGEFRFMSNFYPSEINFEGVDYPTVEHAYQAAKSNVPEVRLAVRQLSSPGDAKNFGRHVALRADWEDVKLPIMLRLLQKKFQDDPLKSQLLSTGEQELEETNYWHDNFWGNCTCTHCRNIAGSNHLGRLLMQVRGELHA